MAVIDNSLPRADSASDLDRSNTHHQLNNSSDDHHRRPSAHNANDTNQLTVKPNDGWNDKEGFKRDMQELEDLLSKLNPMAKEFVPPSLAYGFNTNDNGFHGGPGVFAYPINNFVIPTGYVDVSNGNMFRRKENFSLGKRRMNNRTSMAQKEDVIKRTVYVSDIDQQVTEEQLAALFLNCGRVVDCRVCGDPKYFLRFAFVEFTDEEGARAALHLSGTMLGFYPVRVLPSKTAITPVNPTFLPRISQADVRNFFESVCGKMPETPRDHIHSTRIAFVEFLVAESAILALNCSGVVLGSPPIRVSPSNTPVRPPAPRQAFH